MEHFRPPLGYVVDSWRRGATAGVRNFADLEERNARDVNERHGLALFISSKQSGVRALFDLPSLDAFYTNTGVLPTRRGKRILKGVRNLRRLDNYVAGGGLGAPKQPRCSSFAPFALSPAPDLTRHGKSRLGIHDRRSLTCMTWSISMALLTTKVVRSFTYTPLSTFSFNSSLSLGSCGWSCG